MMLTNATISIKSLGGKKISIILCGLLLLFVGAYFGYTAYQEKQVANIKKAEQIATYKILATPIREVVKNKDLLGQAIKLLGVKRLMEKLVADSSGGGVFDCHQEAHAIGRTGYELDKEKVFGECSASCHSGCYHGAMESFLHDRGTANLAANIHEICKIFKTSFSEFECLHGVGHGVLAYFDYDLPATLKQCGELSSDFERTSCYGGTFMENIITGQGFGANPNVHETKYLSQDPLFPCNAIDGSYAIQSECYKMQTSWMLTIFEYDFDKVAAECLRAPTSMVHTCFLSYGRDAAGQSLREPNAMARYCSKIPESYRGDCVTGAVNVVIDFWGPSLQDQATDFCKKLTGNEKFVCYSTLQSRLNGLFATNEEKQKVCRNFEPEFQNLCGAFQ